jgi:ribonuclease E
VTGPMSSGTGASPGIREFERAVHAAESAAAEPTREARYEEPPHEAPAAALPEPAPQRPPAERAPEPRAPAQDPAEIERALEASGLQLVQTKPGVQAETPADSEFVPAKRERRPPPAELNQPLVQVETRNKEDAPS